MFRLSFILSLTSLCCIGLEHSHSHDWLMRRRSHDDRKSTVTVEQCSCQREQEIASYSDNVPYEDTTCGREAYARGPGQKVNERELHTFLVQSIFFSSKNITETMTAQ